MALFSLHQSESEDPDRGQPCMRCGEQCPGFRMHGWRYGTSKHAFTHFLGFYCYSSALFPLLMSNIGAIPNQIQTYVTLPVWGCA